MASKKRTRLDDDQEVRSEAVEAYQSDLESAGDLLFRYYKSYLLTDESWDGQVAQVGRVQNVRTILALAEGVRLRRLDAASRS